MGAIGPGLMDLRAAICSSSFACSVMNHFILMSRFLMARLDASMPIWYGCGTGRGSAPLLFVAALSREKGEIEKEVFGLV